MKSKIALVTRSMNDTLYELSGELLKSLNLERIQLKNLEADEYFYALSDINADWIVNIDEDAFVSHPLRIPELINYMEEKGYDIAGMPDGGVCQHRFHNPLVPNAFFTIHRGTSLQNKFNKEEIENTKFEESYMSQFPKSLIKGTHAFDEFEPYYRYFFWLLKNKARFLYLDAISWNRDMISTILLDHLNKPFLIHCWYSRAFEEQKTRFEYAWKFANEIQEKTKNGL